MSTEQTSITAAVVDVARVSGVSVEFVDAVCCGAQGCQERQRLIRATIESYGTRVLCPDHLADLVEREGYR